MDTSCGVGIGEGMWFCVALQPCAQPAAPCMRTPVCRPQLLRTLRGLNLCNGLWLIVVGILVFFTATISVTFDTVRLNAGVPVISLWPAPMSSVRIPQSRCRRRCPAPVASPQVVLSAFVCFFGILMTCLECNIGNCACMRGL